MGCCAPIKPIQEETNPIQSPGGNYLFNKQKSLSHQLDRIIKKKEEAPSPKIQLTSESAGSYRENEIHMKRVSRVKLNTSIMQDPQKKEMSGFGKRSKNSKRANTVNFGEGSNFMQTEFKNEYTNKELQIIT